MFVVGRKVNMLSKVEGREKREELRGEVVRRIIEMNVEVFTSGSGVECCELPAQSRSMFMASKGFRAFLIPGITSPVSCIFFTFV